MSQSIKDHYQSSPLFGANAPYVEDPRTLERLASLMRLPRDAFAHLGSVSTHAVLEASVAGEGSTYPVVLFSHGRCGVREHNTVLVEELDVVGAAHGRPPCDYRIGSA